MPTIIVHLPEDKLNRVQKAADDQNKSAGALIEDAIDAYLPRLDLRWELPADLQVGELVGGSGPAISLLALKLASFRPLDPHHSQGCIDGAQRPGPIFARAQKSGLQRQETIDPDGGDLLARPIDLGVLKPRKRRASRSRRCKGRI